MNDLKRKRSPSHDQLHPPLHKAAKTHNHLQINYLARHCNDDLPLITNDDTLPNILTLLNDYQGVLDRHESMACNLGARPLGPILIKRFERLFDGPPRVLKSHGKDGTTVSWLDVVEFARNKSEQFQLGQMSEGVRVCQFYTKQCRVQISEEDFVLISSGIPQKMIPPQPITEDEEKELGTLEILEKNLAQICQLADQVAARTRQLNHRLKGRKQAILDRRATASPVPPIRATSPSNVALMNGAAQAASTTLASLLSQPSQGFVAVNSRPPADQNGSNAESSRSGASTTTRQDLLNKFFTLSDRRPSSQPSNGDARRASSGPQQPSSHPTTPSQAPKPTIKASSSQPPSVTPSATIPPASQMTDAEIAQLLLQNNSPVPIPGTPASLLPAPTPRGAPPTEKDDGGPFKAEMVHRMETLAKGERILPPCDRCRRLHMDCLKNLTACMGCTKKHAKCSWKEVREGELHGMGLGLGLSVGSGGSGVGMSGGGGGVASEDEGFEAASTGSAPREQRYSGSPGRLGSEEEREGKRVREQLQEAAKASMAQAKLDQQRSLQIERERELERERERESGGREREGVGYQAMVA
ncbi:uncharacterized protein BDZ99DRAFT_432385 [Mytilinidion resinicola]|uniref:Zn(2)-C6 fungal-type domain-containing protein n=1 Tax=Mytilinidion resinicola TaxID=574789 RepID=A0A6A6Z4V7_9PEZI|nr:uncharacterized protein BDZ99DRAFT_432385 [Mytilinidion resinicola]KAF2815693.1 hypothetical protein BDZ99DRAFT_432385 [Mytilinidion resinicola]